MRVRPAIPADAAGLAAVHVGSWQVAYRGLLPDDVLDRLDVERYTRGWERLLAETDWPRQGALLAEAPGGEVTGFVHLAPTRDDDGTRPPARSR